MQRIPRTTPTAWVEYERIACLPTRQAQNHKHWGQKQIYYLLCYPKILNPNYELELRYEGWKYHKNWCFLELSIALLW
ncbi:MAG: hypothetical protein AAF934_07745 [Bacteroidota bacterium]